VLVPELSSPDSEYSPTISYDGLEIFIGTNRPGGLGGYDVWHATRASLAAPFDPPVDMMEINSSADDYPGNTSRDRLSLVLWTHRYELVRSDLYVSTRTDPALPFAPPERANISIDGVDEIDTKLSADAQTVYFSANTVGNVEAVTASRSCP